MTETIASQPATRESLKGDESDMALTTTEIAQELGITAKHLRKFLRADARNSDKADTLPGKGGRYSFERKDLKGIKSRYTKWNAAEIAKRAETAKAKESAESDITPEPTDS
jgi:predicted transcriptional regulator